MKASDITDEVLLAAIEAVRGKFVPSSSSRWDIEEALPQFPAKVVRAKLRSAVKRQVIYGCACGCRGDFEII